VIERVVAGADEEEEEEGERERESVKYLFRPIANRIESRWCRVKSLSRVIWESRKNNEDNNCLLRYYYYYYYYIVTILVITTRDNEEWRGGTWIRYKIDTVLLRYYSTAAIIATTATASYQFNSWQLAVAIGIRIRIRWFLIPSSNKREYTPVTSNYPSCNRIRKKKKMWRHSLPIVRSKNSFYFIYARAHAKRVLKSKHIHLVH